MPLGAVFGHGLAFEFLELELALELVLGQDRVQAVALLFRRAGANLAVRAHRVHPEEAGRHVDGVPALAGLEVQDAPGGGDLLGGALLEDVLPVFLRPEFRGDRRITEDVDRVDLDPIACVLDLVHVEFEVPHGQPVGLPGVGLGHAALDAVDLVIDQLDLELQATRLDLVPQVLLA